VLRCWLQNLAPFFFSLSTQSTSYIHFFSFFGLAHLLCCYEGYACGQLRCQRAVGCAASPRYPDLCVELCAVLPESAAFAGTVGAQLAVQPRVPPAFRACTAPLQRDLGFAFARLGLEHPLRSARGNEQF